MKQRHKRLLILIVISLNVVNIFAYDFEVDGIYYDLISEVEKTVEVVGIKDDKESLNIPEEITVSDNLFAVISIGDKFRNNMGSGLFSSFSGSSILIPKSITKISTYALSGGLFGCQSLREINVADNNPTYKSIDGVLYSKDGTALLLWPAEKSDSEIISVSNTVNKIGDYAFQGCKAKFIDLPNTVVEIGNGAFAYPYCSEIVIPASVKRIGRSLAMESYSVESFVYKGNLEQWSKIEILGDLNLMKEWNGYGLKHFVIGGEDMLNVRNLVIPEGTTEIKDYTFANFWNLSSIRFPNGLESIGKGAFSGCPLYNIIHIPESVSYIGEIAFKEAKCPIVKIEASKPPLLDSYTGPDGIEYWQPFSDDLQIFVQKGCKKQYETAGWRNTIEENKVEVTLSGKNSLFDELFQKNVTPNRVTDLIVYGSINENDWIWINSNMTSLRCIDASDTDCINIPYGAFEDNKTLAQITFPNNLETISGNAFKGCNNLCGNIKLPQTLNKIGDYAFYNCSKIAEVPICNGIKIIGDYAFADCSSLMAADIIAALDNVGNYTFAFCESLREISLSDHVRTIGNSCFRGCTQLIDIEFPKSLESIDSYAFKDCQHITSLDLSNCMNLEQIGEQAFQNCLNIETLNLPSCQFAICKEAFADCTSLKHISSFSEMPPAISAKGNPFKNVDNMLCLLSIPTKSFRDYFKLPYWAGFLAFEDKGQIQINIAGEKKLGCSIYYKKNDSVVRNNRMKLSGTGVKEDFNALTSDGASIFVPDYSSVTFEIIADNGKEVIKLLYGGQDVTAQLIGSSYTTPIVSATEVKKLDIVIADYGSVEEISNALTVYAANNEIVVDSAKENINVSVYNLSGQLVYSGTDTIISMPTNGIYIVKIAGQTFKVVL